jgi:hypothetical protein
VKSHAPRDPRKPRTELEGLLILRDMPARGILLSEEERVGLAIRRKPKTRRRHELGIGADRIAPGPFEPGPVGNQTLPPRLRHGSFSSRFTKGTSERAGDQLSGKNLPLFCSLEKTRMRGRSPRDRESLSRALGSCGSRGDACLESGPRGADSWSASSHARGAAAAGG